MRISDWSSDVCSSDLADHPPPVVVLDLDRLEANARAMLTRAGRLPIRLGSKSIRCVEVMKRVMALDPRFKGLPCYSAREAAWLATPGFDDLLVAYPTVVRDDLEAAAMATRAGHPLKPIIDDSRQTEIGRASCRERGCQDV